MRMLDELRKTAEWMTDSNGIDACVVRIRDVDTFEAEHPGLKDFTVMCCNCGCLFDDDDAWWAPELFMGEKVFGCQGDGLGGWGGVHLCPACAKEATS